MSRPRDVRYKKYMVELFSFSFNTYFSKDYEFSEEERFRLTPEHVHAYFSNLAYGTPNPTANDSPILARSATIEFAKKAISSFQPNRLLVWNEQTKYGNPTRSGLVNDLIKRIKKEEVRHNKHFILHSILTYLIIFYCFYFFIFLGKKARERIIGKKTNGTLRISAVD